MMRLKSAVLLLVFCVSATVIVVPVGAGPPYYHEEGNVNYPSSHFESIYVARGIGVDDYINMVELALMARAYATHDFDPWGVGWGYYNPDADINGDGIVDVGDIVIASWYWGLNYHYSPFETVHDKTKVKVVAPDKIEIGQQFTVDIEIENVEGLNTYEFTLRWNPNLLRAISVVGGGFISEEGKIVPAIPNPPTSEDYIYVGDSLTISTEPTTQSGSGTLATITFECLGKSKVTLDLSSRLFDNNLVSMPHNDLDGEIKQKKSP